MMQFAVSLPWWAVALLLGAAVLVAWASYRRTAVPVTVGRRAALVAMRAATLVALIACLLRPIRVLPPDAASDAVVPILVDVSRSMSIEDADGRSRIQAAHAIVDREITPALSGRFTSEVWRFGDSLRRLPAAATGGATDGLWAPDARRSDLSGALHEIRQRYRERRVAGIVVISDGGDTGNEDAATVLDDDAVPVFTVGVGSTQSGVDFEVLDVAAGEATVVDAAVDITVSAVSRGREGPFDLRLLENGRPVDLRRVSPTGPSSPVRVVFTASPSGDAATVYTVEIPSASEESVVENNRRSVVVEPPGRRRRVLMIAGAPGFEHSFLKRALDSDPAIELDSVVRKGRDTTGEITYFIQAPAGRAPLLVSGFPKDRAVLYAYDAVVLANVEPDTLTRVQLEHLATFVEERGGGLLMLGAKSFAQGGLAGTPLEEVLPLILSGRAADVVGAASIGSDAFGVSLTADGAMHPVTRIAATAEDATRRWQAIPSLAALSAVGGPRAGAQVLALVRTPAGSRPLVAVQRYGQGRSMVFAGEASWRWRMMLPSTDRTYELFWRHAMRWLAAKAPDMVEVSSMASPGPGDEGTVSAIVRDAEFRPVTNASLAIRVTAPSGATTELRPTLTDSSTGRYSSVLRFDEPGLYRVSADARRDSQTVGSPQRWILVGGADREMTDPRLNEDVLRRLARATGAQYLHADDVSTLPSLIQAMTADPGFPRVQEVWHSAWMFAAIVALLSTEWVLRRQWGFR